MNETRKMILSQLLRADRGARLFGYMAAGLSLPFAIYYMVVSPKTIPSILFCELIVLAVCGAEVGLRYLNCRVIAFNGEISLGKVSGFTRTYTMRKVVSVKPRDALRQYDATGKLIGITCYAPHYILRRLHPESDVYVIRAKGIMQKHNFPYVVADISKKEEFKSL